MCHVLTNNNYKCLFIPSLDFYCCTLSTVRAQLYRLQPARPKPVLGHSILLFCSKTHEMTMSRRLPEIYNRSLQPTANL